VLPLHPTWTSTKLHSLVPHRLGNSISFVSSLPGMVIMQMAWTGQVLNSCCRSIYSESDVENHLGKLYMYVY
jgi:hypothetical protein